jgi:hypothetical protein
MTFSRSFVCFLGLTAACSPDGSGEPSPATHHDVGGDASGGNGGDGVGGSGAGAGASAGGASGGACGTAQGCGPGQVCVQNTCVSPEDPCRGATCSGHGTCSAPDGTPTCHCADGYAGDGLSCVAQNCTPAPHASSACDTGNVYWYDSCGLKQDEKQSCDGRGCSGTTCNAAPCDGVTCSGHGTCAAEAAGSVCTCDAGYHASAAACVPDGGVQGLTIPTTHPRLVFNPGNLAAAKTWYAAHSSNPKSALDNALKGLLAGDAAACGSAVESAKADSTAMRTTGTACDDCRWSGEMDLLVYDWYYGLMTEADRTSLEGSLDTWIEHWRTEAWGGVPMHENNYYWGYLRNEFEWGVLSNERNSTLAAKELDDVFNVRLKNDFYPSAANGGTRGGIGQEGAQYGVYVLGYAAVPLFSAEQMGRDMFDETSYYLGAVYAYIFETTPDGQMFSWNDDDAYAPGAPSPFIADYMTVAAMHWKDSKVGAYARNWLKTYPEVVPSAHFQAVDTGAPTAAAFDGLPLDYFAAGPRYLFGRSGWKAANTSFMLMLGEEDGVGHNHADYGSFQIFRGGKWLSRESVGYGYSAVNVVGLGGSGSSDVRTAVAHNTVAVGTKLAADGGAPKVTRLESQAGFSFASVDLSSSYGGSKVVRDFVFVRSLETMVVFDRGSSVFLAHCETAPEASGGSATCTNGSQALVVNSLLGNPSIRVVTEGGKSGQSRMEITAGAQGPMLTVLQAKDAAAKALVPTVVDGGANVTVTLDPSVSIQFASGAASTGGSITINGVTTALRADVQTMTIAASGPAWQ